MRTLLFFISLILLVFPVNACLIEYRVVEFTPENGVYVQNVSEDFAMLNLTNSFGFMIAEGKINYRGEEIRISEIPPGATVSGEKRPLDNENFDISINYSIEGSPENFSVKFEVKNTNVTPIKIKISFPEPEWLDWYENCQIGDGEVVFSSNLPPNAKDTFVLKGSGSRVELEDGRIELGLLEVASVLIYPEIQVKVEKSGQEGNWSVRMETCNPYDFLLNVTLFGYVNESTPPHSINNSEKILEVTESIPPSKCIEKSFTLNSSDAPGVFFKAISFAESSCEVQVFSASKVGNNYVQYGIIRGFSFEFPSPTSTPTPTPEENPVPPSGGGGAPPQPPALVPTPTVTPAPESIPSPAISPTPLPTPTPTPTQTSTPTPTQKETPESVVIPPEPVKPEEIEKVESDLPLVFPLKSDNTTKSNLLGVEVKSISVEPSVAITVAIATMLPLMMFFFPIALNRSGIILDSAEILREISELDSESVYLPMREFDESIPPNVQGFNADDELVRELHEIYDIPLNSAEAIAMAIELGLPVYLSDRNAYEVALNLEIDAIYYPKNFINSSRIGDDDER